MSIDVDVNTRFKSSAGIFEDDDVKVQIRGMQREDPAELDRIVNPRDGITKEAVETELEKVGMMETRIADKLFGDNIPLYSRKPNDNWIARMSLKDGIERPQINRGSIKQSISGMA